MVGEFVEASGDLRREVEIAWGCFLVFLGLVAVVGVVCVVVVMRFDFFMWSDVGLNW